LLVKDRKRKDIRDLSTVFVPATKQSPKTEQFMFFMQSFNIIGLHNIHNVSIYREEN